MKEHINLKMIFWKIFSFQNELERYSKAEYGKAPSELNAEELAKKK